MEIYQDYEKRMEKREERRKIQKLKEGPDFKDGQWSAEICESNLNKIKEEGKKALREAQKLAEIKQLLLDKEEGFQVKAV